MFADASSPVAAKSGLSRNHGHAAGLSRAGGHLQGTHLYEVRGYLERVARAKQVLPQPVCLVVFEGQGSYWNRDSALNYQGTQLITAKLGVINVYELQGKLLKGAKLELGDSDAQQLWLKNAAKVQVAARKFASGGISRAKSGTGISIKLKGVTACPADKAPELTTAAPEAEALPEAVDAAELPAEAVEEQLEQERPATPPVLPFTLEHDEDMSADDANEEPGAAAHGLPADSALHDEALLAPSAQKPAEASSGRHPDVPEGRQDDSGKRKGNGRSRSPVARSRSHRSPDKDLSKGRSHRSSPVAHGESSRRRAASPSYRRGPRDRRRRSRSRSPSSRGRDRRRSRSKSPPTRGRGSGRRSRSSSPLRRRSYSRRDRSPARRYRRRSSPDYSAIKSDQETNVPSRPRSGHSDSPLPRDHPKSHGHPGDSGALKLPSGSSAQQGGSAVRKRRRFDVQADDSSGNQPVASEAGASDPPPPPVPPIAQVPVAEVPVEVQEWKGALTCSFGDDGKELATYARAVPFCCPQAQGAWQAAGLSPVGLPEGIIANSTVSISPEEWASTLVPRWSGCVFQLLQEDLPIAGKVTVASSAKRKRAKITFKTLCTRLREQPWALKTQVSTLGGAQPLDLLIFNDLETLEQVIEALPEEAQEALLDIQENSMGGIEDSPMALILLPSTGPPAATTPEAGVGTSPVKRSGSRRNGSTRWKPEEGQDAAGVAKVQQLDTVAMPSSTVQSPASASAALETFTGLAASLRSRLAAGTLQDTCFGLGASALDSVLSAPPAAMPEPHSHPLAMSEARSLRAPWHAAPPVPPPAGPTPIPSTAAPVLPAEPEQPLLAAEDPAADPAIEELIKQAGMAIKDAEGMSNSSGEDEAAALHMAPDAVPHAVQHDSSHKKGATVKRPSSSHARSEGGSRSAYTHERGESERWVSTNIAEAPAPSGRTIRPGSSDHSNRRTVSYKRGRSPSPATAHRGGKRQVPQMPTLGHKAFITLRDLYWEV
ncbi:hypothetical protein WJX73_006569 [Symbiochloris irregularis]|uniref:Uncharacterized protein n=1 Tax=Symbiochloris irregularis TaxID=706552 RepID=A0AAW1NVN9_9CHLO